MSDDDDVCYQFEPGEMLIGELNIFVACRQMGKTRMTEQLLRELGYIPVLHTLETNDDDITPKDQE